MFLKSVIAITALTVSSASSAGELLLQKLSISADPTGYRGVGVYNGLPDQSAVDRQSQLMRALGKYPQSLEPMVSATETGELSVILEAAARPSAPSVKLQRKRAQRGELVRFSAAFRSSNEANRFAEQLARALAIFVASEQTTVNSGRGISFQVIGRRGKSRDLVFYEVQAHR